MPTLEDLLKALERIGVEAYEIPLSRNEYAALIQRGRIIVASEENQDE